MSGHVFDVCVGSFDSEARLFCLSCSDESAACGSAWRSGFFEEDGSRLCVSCGVDVVALAGDVVGYRSVADPSVLLCESCYWDVCDDRVKGDYQVLLRPVALAVVESERVCACCRELVCS